MTSEEHHEIIAYLAALLDEYGLGSISVRGQEAPTPDAESSRQFLLAYLDAVSSELHVRSKDAYVRTLGLTNEFISTADGRRIEDIVVDLSRGEREIYDRPSISLSSAPDFSPLIAGLREVFNAVAEDRVQ